MKVTKPINLEQLQVELISGGVPVPHGLILYGEDLLKIDDVGNPVELEPAAVPIVDAHVAQPTEAEQAESDFNSTYKAMVTRLDAIIDNGATYTAAQVRDAVIDEAKAIKKLARITRNLTRGPV